MQDEITQVKIQKDFREKPMKKLIFIFVLFTFLNTDVSFAKNYEIPPSNTTYSNVPYISDEAMEKCVILYNQAKWLAEEINATQVDRYSQISVDAYNHIISTHSQMITAFNRDCAGKQSESAYKAAQELNKKIME